MNIASKHCTKSLVSFSFVFFLLISILISDRYAAAQQLVCPQRAIEQITDKPEGTSIEPALSGDGTRIAIRSRDNEFASFQLLLFDTTDETLSQITDLTDDGISNPSINFDGTRIAFDSSANITGDNPGEITQIFLFDNTTGIFTQVTNGDEPSSRPSINADGTRIAFDTRANINGGNPGGMIDQIFLVDTTTGVFTQITDDMFEASRNPSINADGTKIAFESRANINGGNPGGITQIFLFDSTTGSITQFTNGDDSSTDASINADGTRIAFDSSANINGSNPENNTEIYLFDTTTGQITQITDETDGNSDSPSINTDGTRIAFDSRANINGGNPGGETQIFLFDTTTGMFIQITQESSGASNDVSISADGLRIAFDSTANINGGNPEGNSEVFLAVCFDPETFRNIPTLSEWGLIAMAGVLGLIGFIVIRKRKAAL